jgi:ABC-type nitrate/sulfonate/bicarbonate transport system substrate-binding protein
MAAPFLLCQRLLAIACLTGLVVGSAAAQDKPVRIRLGIAPCVEEALCLMKARPGLTPNQGKVYQLELLPFRAGDIRFQAYLAHEIDGGTTSFSGLIQAAARGVELITVAAISAESDQTFSTSFVVLENSPIRSAKDLKGKAVGIPGFKNTFELIIRTELLKVGLNPDRDVEWVVTPVPAMGQALRSGKIALGSFVQPFYANELAAGGMRTLFTSVSALGMSEELDIFMNPDFLKRNPDAVRAFLSDFIAATKFYVDHIEEARQALLKEKMIQIEPSAFLTMKNLAPIADGRPSIGGFEKMQDHMLNVGFIDRKIEIAKIVDTSYLPK